MKNIAIVKLIPTERKMTVGAPKSVTKAEYDVIRLNIQKLGGMYRLVHMDNTLTVDGILDLCNKEEEKRAIRETENREYQKKNKIESAYRKMSRQQKEQWKSNVINFEFESDKISYLLESAK